MTTPKHILLPLSCLLLSATAFAQTAPSGPPPAPPPEAIAACAGKAVGAQVSFTGRRGDTVTGTCQLIGDVLAARPTGGPPPTAK
ncbi:MAG TPA: hypothetical protein VLJ57_23645 [Burkholderiaceae bacterium]|nr:hypothetical protein [Burkholderiaceae bacterium]